MDTYAVENASPNARLTKAMNPLVKLLFRTPLRRRLARLLLLVEFTGRKTGRVYQFPAGAFDIDGRTAITSRQRWQHNFDGGVPCRVKRFDGWVAARGTRVADVDEAAKIWSALIDRVGIENTKRKLGLEVTVGRPPTHDEMVEAVRRIRLSIIFFDLDAGDAAGARD